MIARDHKSVSYAELLFRKGMLVYFSGADIGLALQLLDSAYVLIDKINHPIERLYLLQGYGSVLGQYLNYEKGIKILLEAESLCLNHTVCKDKQMLNIYANLLALAQSSNQFELALEIARKGIEYGEGTDNYEDLADLYNNNGVILASLEMLDEAEDSYLKALELNKKGDLKWGVAYSQMSLGLLYNIKKQHQKAFPLLKAANAYFIENVDYYSIAIVNQSLCQNYILEKNYARALMSINRSIEYLEKDENARAIIGLYYNKAQVLFELGQYDEAYAIAQKELAVVDNQFYAPHTYDLLSQIEAKRSNFENALLFQNKYSELRDSVYNENLENKLAKERVKQNIEKEQESREKAELKSSLLESQNRFFIAISLGLAAILGMGGFLFYKLQKARNLLKSQNQQLSELNRTKDKFFGIIAHDIRSPIVALDGVGEQMSYYLDKKDESKLRRLSDRVDTTAKRLSNLLDNLLNWALLQTGTIPYRPVSLNLRGTANEVLALFTPHATTKNIQLVNEVSTSIKVYADPSALNAILRNLVSNAIKFTHKDGQVSIAAEEKGGKVFIKINDTGTGINAELLPKLFTLNKNNKKGTGGEKGTGLGLLLCKELVELNKGNISVISELGQGSSFAFSLPKSHSL